MKTDSKITLNLNSTYYCKKCVHHFGYIGIKYEDYE